MPLIEGKVDPLKFNATTLRKVMQDAGALPSVLYGETYEGLAQRVLEGMISEGMVVVEREI